MSFIETHKHQSINQTKQIKQLLEHHLDTSNNVVQAQWGTGTPWKHLFFAEMIEKVTTQIYLAFF